MGAIFHYARRIVEELGEILGVMQTTGTATPAPAEAAAASAAAKSQFDDPPTTPRAVQAFWEEAATNSSGQAPGKDGALSYEQARKLGLIPDDSTT